ncbi:MAG: metallophosphoesterase [Symploca sp. SIO2E6]|nr:metallophosphoesterase [Symploca sp. SIO2E6]
MHSIFSGSLCVEQVKVAIANLPTELQGTKLVQLSDLHYDGWRLSEKMLAQAIAATNQAEPDLIVLTGDYVTDNPAPIDQLAQRLKYLQSRFGIYAILGNHDLYYHYSKVRVIDALTSIGIKVLWNEVAYPLGQGLPLVGLADLFSPEFNPAPTMNQLTPHTPRIVLAHNPDTAELLQQWRVDLQLSGHTHGGQIIIPGFGPAPKLLHMLGRSLPKSIRCWIPLVNDCSRIVERWQWSKGMYQIGTNQLYVNRGLGTYAPGRFFCPPEVTVITLELRIEN